MVTRVMRSPGDSTVVSTWMFWRASDSRSTIGQFRSPGRELAASAKRRHESPRGRLRACAALLGCDGLVIVRTAHEVAALFADKLAFELGQAAGTARAEQTGVRRLGPRRGASLGFGFAGLVTHRVGFAGTARCLWSSRFAGVRCVSRTADSQNISSAYRLRLRSLVCEE